MTYSPPFTLTPQILNQVGLISEQVALLQLKGYGSSPQLRKNNRIKTITGTLQIEGNTLEKNAPVNIAGMKTNDAILKLIAQNSHITRKEMAKQIGKDIRTIGRAIKQLQEKKQLKRVGSDKTGHWELI